MKEQYVNMRNRNLIDLGVLYTYAVGKGFTLSIDEFAVGLRYSDINNIFRQLDQEFNLTLLHDKNDKFIKVIE